MNASLQPCPACGNQVSSAAMACPRCGHPLQAPPAGYGPPPVQAFGPPPPPVQAFGAGPGYSQAYGPQAPYAQQPIVTRAASAGTNNVGLGMMVLGGFGMIGGCTYGFNGGGFVGGTLFWGLAFVLAVVGRIVSAAK
ncbi:MAG: zinc-ribbon domain-containing protein [Polyangiaceae bacterium]|nr:zinc-ribbon domain-containing protein [Polyangiaceae bacterium]